MDSLSFFNNMEGSRPVFTPAVDSTSASTESSSASRGSGMNAASTEFAPLAPALQTHSPNELMSLLGQQEPRIADTAPSSPDIEEMLRSLCISGSERAFNAADDTESSQSNYFTGHNNRAESVASSRGNLWSDASSIQQSDQQSAFDFLVKSVSAANTYVSMLTREQLSVLQSLRPGLLHEFLHEVARVRAEKRTRRALPNECAFCKNNGENEEHYTSHALKDWRGRVLCPVLRAFRCPRCGSTGDRAHTIKYCPENDADRQGLQGRRRMPPSASLLENCFLGQNDGLQSPGQAGCAPPPSPSQLCDSSLWSSFGLH